MAKYEPARGLDPFQLAAGRDWLQRFRPEFLAGLAETETGEEVAIKKIGNAFDKIIDAKRTLREIKLFRNKDHENVIAVKDIIRPPLREKFNDVYIVYELMDTDLHQTIRSNQSLTDYHCRFQNWFPCYIYSYMLLNANCDLKLGDFGLARTRRK
ncbi:hypothetical protein IGI04_035842 [Brassica rapa subsp. trilocularis]|uniref:Protein kinase domain-containing protein n=1 Tax=Brassica rapa subsp. trilocularis TaxID=1813537 RepID=A0ABQ7LDQ2_BRACM|nr:hypothetical protein IGI04_035842 [Brassica rapa subsp. trilocularis]